MNKRILISLFLFSITFFLYSYKLSSSFQFDTDFARDASDILDISQGDLRLIGPKSSFGGLYSPPYYYYLFVPIFIFTKNNIEGFLYFNSLLFAGGIGFCYYLISKKNKFFTSFLLSLSVAISPLYLFASRNPGNFTSYIPFLLIIMTIITYHISKSRIKLLILGLFAGMLMTFDYVVVFLLPFFSIYIFKIIKNFKKVLIFILGFLLALSPLIIFELTHNFVMLKNTFINGSYISFLKSANLPGSTLLINLNIIERFSLIGDEVSRQCGMSIYLIFLIALTSQIFYKKKDNLYLFCVLAFLSLLVLSIILKFQYAQHYVYPVTIFILFSILILLQKRNQSIFLFLILIVQVVSFPISQYNLSTRPYYKFRKIIDDVIKNKLVSKDSSFNIIQVRNDTAVAISGHEYRFFLKKAKFIPKSVFDYKTAKSLLIFSEDKNFDLGKLNNWEIREYGEEYKIDKNVIIDSILVLRLVK